MFVGLGRKEPSRRPIECQARPKLDFKMEVLPCGFQKWP
jgi:hypothetical protein